MVRLATQNIDRAACQIIVSGLFGEQRPGIGICDEPSRSVAVKRALEGAHAARDEVNVVGLKNTTKVGLVRGAGAQPLDRRLLVAERFEEGIRKVLGVKRLIRQLRNGFFYFNGVQLLAPP